MKKQDSFNNSLKSIDLNCDMGELNPETLQNFDASIMPYISSCNIACGFHSGNANSIEHTIRLALEHKVAIGAHPSYKDRENFGRKSIDISIEKLIPQIRYQISALKGMTESLGGSLHHVKAHGALYNDMIADDFLAIQFVELIQSIDPNLAIMGFAESNLSTICQSKNIRFINEVFADRVYENKTKLRSRKLENSVLHKKEAVLDQVKLFLENKVRDYQQNLHSINVDSVCLHSDTKGAIALSENIYDFIKSNNIEIRIPQ